MKINKRFSAVLCFSALLHGHILFFASMPQTVEKISANVPAKPFSLINAEIKPEAPAPVRTVKLMPPREKTPSVETPVETLLESSPDGIIQETENPAPPPQALAVAYTARESDNALADYARNIRSRIDKNKEYPYQSRRQEQEGLVRVRFTLTRDGLLAGDPVLAGSCRHSRLNTAALEAVRRAQPYPAFPPQIQEETMNFTIEVVFSLKK
ncbi:MAG: TonB family protein [Spirochaetales bacterium]|jgi:protein TonB|nr:TonB family protein [Spirochaetales bacterium]